MKILFAGDIVIYKTDKFSISERLKELFLEQDICVCNFEAPIANSEKDLPALKAGPYICQGIASIEWIETVGFNLVSLANNHIMDYGNIGLKNTLDAFIDKNIPVIGAGFSFEEAYKPYFFKIEKIKVAFIALGQAEFGVFKHDKIDSGYAWINHPSINNLVAETKKEVDFLYIISHAGVEQIIYPLPEWQTRYRELIDCGADGIIASHPHIIQGYEIYKNKHIFYSLGNFYFSEKEIKEEARKEWNRSLLTVVNTDFPDKVSIIPVFFKNNIIDIDESPDFKLDFAMRSNLLLDSEKYIETMNEIAEKLWNKYYKNYYIRAIRPGNVDINNLSLKRILIHFLKRVINKTRLGNWKVLTETDNTMLLHNIQIESHRWIVERYLYNCNVNDNKVIRS
jgi:poly-gamma-glutamate synthesis protein (capsule biosynthesis protein)